MRVPRRLLPRLALLASAPLLCLLPAFCVGPPWYYAEKYAPAAGSRRGGPLARVSEVRPEKQTEPHTCGLHALGSVYRAYGLDPDGLELRFRLGTDKPFTNLIPSSRGTIHPDMLRVLHQDGFAADVVHPSDPVTAAARLGEHLDAGRVAVALVVVNDYHWIVLSGRDGDDVVICDSLRDEPYREPLRAFVRDRVYSLLLVRPGG